MDPPVQIPKLPCPTENPGDGHFTNENDDRRIHEINLAMEPKVHTGLALIRAGIAVFRGTAFHH